MSTEPDFTIFNLTTIHQPLKPVITKSTNYVTDIQVLDKTRHECIVPHKTTYTPLQIQPIYTAKQYPFQLDTFQKFALSAIDRHESILVSAHTSAGKTVIAEYAVATCLKNQQRCIYTSPIKALSNQKFRELQLEFKDVGLITGDVTLNPNASVLVMTTEILRNMFYKGNEILREVAYIIFDEIHYLREKERGVVWEECIILCPNYVRMIFLSATVPNAVEFARWVSEICENVVHVVYTEKRPTPLEHYLVPYGNKNFYKILYEKKDGEKSEGVKYDEHVKNNNMNINKNNKMKEFSDKEVVKSKDTKKEKAKRKMEKKKKEKKRREGKDKSTNEKTIDEKTKTERTKKEKNKKRRKNKTNKQNTEEEISFSSRKNKRNKIDTDIVEKKVLFENIKNENGKDIITSNSIKLETNNNSTVSKDIHASTIDSFTDKLDVVDKKSTEEITQSNLNVSPTGKMQNNVDLKDCKDEYSGKDNANTNQLIENNFLNTESNVNNEETPRVDNTIVNPDVFIPDPSLSIKHTFFDVVQYQSAMRGVINQRLKDNNLDIKYIITEIIDRGLLPSIIFSFSRKDCEKYALGIEHDFLNESQKKKVNDWYNAALTGLREEDRNLQFIKSLLPLLLRGVGIHHSGLLPILKEIVEILFQEGLLKILFATETFSIGLNMPARSVVFTALHKFDGEEKRVLSSGEYIQMSGRAGRRGLDDKGVVIAMVKQKMDIKTGRRLFSGLADKLVSAFRLTYNMILNLKRLEGYDTIYLLERSFYHYQCKREREKYFGRLKKMEEVVEMIMENDKKRMNTKEEMIEVKNKEKRKAYDIAYKELRKSNVNVLYEQTMMNACYIENKIYFEELDRLFMLTDEQFMEYNLKLLFPNLEEVLYNIDYKLLHPLTIYKLNELHKKVRLKRNELKYKYLKKYMEHGRLVHLFVASTGFPTKITRAIIKSCTNTEVQVNYSLNEDSGITNKKFNINVIDRVFDLRIKSLFHYKKVSNREIEEIKTNYGDNTEEIEFMNSLIRIIERTLYWVDVCCIYCGSKVKGNDCLFGRCFEEEELELYFKEDYVKEIKLADDCESKINEDLEKNGCDIINYKEANLLNKSKKSIKNLHNKKSSEIITDFINEDKSMNDNECERDNNLINIVNDSKRINGNKKTSTVWQNEMQRKYHERDCNIDKVKFGNENKDIDSKYNKIIETLIKKQGSTNENGSIFEEKNFFNNGNVKDNYRNNNEMINNNFYKNKNYREGNFRNDETRINESNLYKNRNFRGNNYRNDRNTEISTNKQFRSDIEQKDFFNILTTIRRVFLEEKYKQYYQKEKENMHKLNEIYHMDECKKMIRVLRRLEYCDDYSVLVKGRVACELSSGDELLLTEMMFNGDFAKLPVNQVVPLLSCVIYPDWDNEITISETNQQNYELLKLSIEKIVTVMNDCGLEIDLQSTLKKYSYEMMDLVEKWIGGASFMEICESNIFEGTIIRCFRRLEELLKQLCNAARSIGNSELENLFASGIEKIKRDIVFANSLYL